MLGWYDWLCEMKKRDEVKRMKVDHLKLVSRTIKSADVSAGLLHKITKPTACRGGGRILKKVEDAKPSAGCEEKRQEWAKLRQCDAKVHDFIKEKPWRNDEVEEFGAGHAKVKRKRF